PQTSELEKRLKHSVPIAVMGDYNIVLSKRKVLRDPLAFDEAVNMRPAFGSPFRRNTKRNKKLRMLAIDEAEDVERFTRKRKIEIKEKKKRNQLVHQASPIVQIQKEQKKEESDVMIVEKISSTESSGVVPKPVHARPKHAAIPRPVPSSPAHDDKLLNTL